MFKVNSLIKRMGFQFLKSAHLLTTQSLLWIQHQKFLHQVLRNYIKSIGKFILQLGYFLEYLIFMSEWKKENKNVLFYQLCSLHFQNCPVKRRKLLTAWNHLTLSFSKIEETAIILVSTDSFICILIARCDMD